MSAAMSEGDVLSPHMSLWRPIIHKSPFLVVGSVISSSALSISNSSSSASRSSSSRMQRSSTSWLENPVAARSYPSRSSSRRRSLSFISSHSPVILFRAMFSAFSSFLLRSTTETWASSYPRSERTKYLWWPPMMVPSRFTMIGSTYPNRSTLRLMS